MLRALRGFHSSSESGPLKMLNVTGISAGLSGDLSILSINRSSFCMVYSSGNHASCFGRALSCSHRFPLHTPKSW